VGTFNLNTNGSNRRGSGTIGEFGNSVKMSGESQLNDEVFGLKAAYIGL